MSLVTGCYQRKVETFPGRCNTFDCGPGLIKKETPLRYSIIALQSPDTVRAIFQRMERDRKLRGQMFAEFVRRPKLQREILALLAKNPRLRLLAVTELAKNVQFRRKLLKIAGQQPK